MNELTLFDSIPQNESPSLKDEDFKRMIWNKQINTEPDDLTVIRLLIEKEAYKDAEDSREAAEQYVDKQMEDKFDIYEDNINELDKIREWLCDKVAPTFMDIQQTLLDVLDICASEMQSICICPQKDNAEYIAYLYNLNAPFHNRKPLPYKQLTNTLLACSK